MFYKIAAGCIKYIYPHIFDTKLNGKLIARVFAEEVTLTSSYRILLSTMCVGLIYLHMKTYVDKSRFYDLYSTS